LINSALKTLWELGRNERVNEAIREVQFFANDDDSKLLLELFTNHGTDPESLRATIEALRGSMAEIAGVAVFQGAPADDNEDQRAPLAHAKASPGAYFGDRSLVYETRNHAYQVSAGAFFQVNRFLLDDLMETVTANRSGKVAIDLYSGGGFFSLPLAETFKQVVAVEASTYSYIDLKTNASQNVKPIRVSAEEFLRSEAKRYPSELIVVDPPRAGLGENTARLLGRTSAPRVTYVSCDPATLSRDIKVLIESGFHVEEAHVFDLFPQTFHLESVLHLAR
jgi:23S rRNA (uracil1939-C5)-methyltransferase